MHILARNNRGHQRIHQGMQNMPVNETQPTKGASHLTCCTEWTMGEGWDQHLPIWISWILTGGRLFKQFPTDQSGEQPNGKPCYGEGCEVDNVRGRSSMPILLCWPIRLIQEDQGSSVQLKQLPSTNLGYCYQSHNGYLYDYMKAER